MLTVHENRNFSENLSLVKEKDKTFHLNIQIDDSCVGGHVSCFVVTLRNVTFFSVFFFLFFSLFCLSLFLSPLSFSLPLPHMKRDILQASGKYYETDIFTKIASSWHDMMLIFQMNSADSACKIRPRSRMHERTNSLRFLGIISDFLCGFLKSYGKGHGFLSGFPPFSFTVHSN